MSNHPNDAVTYACTSHINVWKCSKECNNVCLHVEHQRMIVPKGCHNVCVRGVRQRMIVPSVGNNVCRLTNNATTYVCITYINVWLYKGRRATTYVCSYEYLNVWIYSSSGAASKYLLCAPQRMNVFSFCNKCLQSCHRQQYMADQQSPAQLSFSKLLCCFGFCLILC